MQLVLLLLIQPGFLTLSLQPLLQPPTWWFHQTDRKAHASPPRCDGWKRSPHKVPNAGRGEDLNMCPVGRALTRQSHHSTNWIQLDSQPTGFNCQPTNQLIGDSRSFWADLSWLTALSMLRSERPTVLYLPAHRLIGPACAKDPKRHTTSAEPVV